MPVVISNIMFNDGNTAPTDVIYLCQDDNGSFNGAKQQTRETHTHSKISQLTRSNRGFSASLLTQGHIHPTREFIFCIPKTLAVASQN
jgi:hypothetical protein